MIETPQTLASQSSQNQTKSACVTLSKPKRLAKSATELSQWIEEFENSTGQHINHSVKEGLEPPSPITDKKCFNLNEEGALKNRRTTSTASVTLIL